MLSRHFQQHFEMLLPFVLIFARVLDGEALHTNGAAQRVNKVNEDHRCNLCINRSTKSNRKMIRKNAYKYSDIRNLKFNDNFVSVGQISEEYFFAWCGYEPTHSQNYESSVFIF